MDQDPADLRARYHRLTARQQTLVRSLADAASRAEIAEALGVSLSLVDKETAEVMRAFGLQEVGLSRAQRCVELRRMYLQIRRLERSEAATTAPAPPPEPAGNAASPAPAPSAGQDETAAAEHPTPLVLLPPPIPSPPAYGRRWRWWPLAALVVLLLLAAGLWRAAHPPAPPTVISDVVVPPPTAAQEATMPGRTLTVASFATNTPAPPATATATINPAASPVNLAGKVDSTLPGTPSQLGQPVASIVDEGANPRDLYAVSLHAGQTFTVQVTAATRAFSVLLGAPGSCPVTVPPAAPRPSSALFRHPAARPSRWQPMATTPWPFWPRGRRCATP